MMMEMEYSAFRQNNSVV